MGLRGDIASEYKKNGIHGLITSAPGYVHRKGAAKIKYTVRSMGVWASSHNLIGENVFDEDWDLLILLDTCRPDALRTVQDEYPFIEDVGRIRSVGGQSPEWMANTFDLDHLDAISNTAYITANPHAETVFENRLKRHFKRKTGVDNIERLKKWGKRDFAEVDDFGKYEPLYRCGSDGDYAYPPSRYVTDRAIEVGRELDYNRIILHYMPPHYPYISRAKEEGREMEGHEKNPFGYLHRTGDRETVYDAYLHMLRWVLDEVELLLNNIDAEKVVISSDHGEAFGEYGIYKHHSGSIHPHIRYVPWVVTTATDNHVYDPQFDLEEESQRSVEEVLGALGYL